MIQIWNIYSETYSIPLDIHDSITDICNWGYLEVHLIPLYIYIYIYTIQLEIYVIQVEIFLII